MSVPRQKNAEFPPEVVTWWTLKLLLESSKFAVGVMGLASSLLHRNASTLILEISK